MTPYHSHSLRLTRMYCPSSIYRRWGTPVMLIEGQRAAVRLAEHYGARALTMMQRSLARREYAALVGMGR